MLESQRYRSMSDAYRAIYEAKDEGGKKPVVFPMPVIPGQVINKKTTINVEVNPEVKKPGEVEKAYYTYPAGFDPANREDITRKGTTNEEIEITDEEFYDYMIEQNIVSNVESAQAILDHMSDEWFRMLYEGMKEARKNVGASTCWDGYKAKGTKNKGGKEVPNCVKEGKRGLWDNIHAKRKRGGKPAKPGDKNYPKTLNVEGFEQLDEISQKTATSAYANRRTNEFEGDEDHSKSDKTHKRIVSKFGKKAGQHADRAAHAKTFGRSDMPKD